MARRAEIALLSMLSLLGGCGCKCDVPDGPMVDMTAALPDVKAVFEGTFTGQATDDPGESRDDVVFEPCDIAGEAFTVAFTVGEPTCADPDRPEADCTRADRGAFPVSGDLQIADEPAIALATHVEVWSERGGLFLMSLGDLAPADGPYPAQTLDFVMSDDHTLAEAVLLGLSWGRRLSEDDATSTIWQVCALDFQ